MEHFSYKGGCGVHGLYAHHVFKEEPAYATYELLQVI